MCLVKVDYITCFVKIARGSSATATWPICVLRNRRNMEDDTTRSTYLRARAAARKRKHRDSQINEQDDVKRRKTQDAQSARKRASRTQETPQRRLARMIIKPKLQ
jgi:hypothetical protein